MKNKSMYHKPIALKKHHKWILGGFSGIVLVYIVVSSILLAGIITKQTANHISLSNEIEQNKLETQNKINELTDNLFEIKKDLSDVEKDFIKLKASVGEDFSKIVEKSLKSIVTIRTDKTQGTGFIVNKEGYIVTNAHLLYQATELNVITYNQEKIEGQLIGYDISKDLALIKIPGKYEFLELEDSNRISLGEKVIAIGNPLGLQFSVTEGIVSGVHRKGINELEAYIQTDAALNPGNSGSPLINREGKVIGINNFKINRGENLGFALESNYIKETINMISIQKLNRTIIG